jgi:hypothetical protein
VINVITVFMDGPVLVAVLLAAALILAALVVAVPLRGGEVTVKVSTVEVQMVGGQTAGLTLRLEEEAGGFPPPGLTSVALGASEGPPDGPAALPRQPARSRSTLPRPHHPRAPRQLGP